MIPNVLRRFWLWFERVYLVYFVDRVVLASSIRKFY